MARLVRAGRGWRFYALAAPLGVLALALGARLVVWLVAPLVVPAIVGLVLVGLLWAGLTVRRMR